MRNKFLAFFLGILLCCALLEAGLRLGGYFYLQSRKTPPPGRSGPGIILCAGDSFTAGLGAPAGKSYPAQLEQLLKSHRPGYQVVNLGRAGENSATTKQRLLDALPRLRPSTLILLTGGNNGWNYLDVDRNISGVHPLISFLSRIRFVQLLVLITRPLVSEEIKASATGANDESSYPEARAYFRRGEFRAAINAYTAYLASHPGGYGDYWHLGLAYLSSGDRPRAVAALRKAIELKPEGDICARIYCDLGEALLRPPRRDREALSCFFRGISLFPEVTGNPNYFNLMMFKTADAETRKAILALLLKTKGSRRLKDPLLEQTLKAFTRSPDQEDMLHWIRRDILDICRLCARLKIRLIIMGYPIAPEGVHPEQYLVNGLLRELASPSASFLFMDTETFFGSLPSKEAYFVPGDAHCSEKGYALIAERLRDIIVTAGAPVTEESGGPR